MDQEPQAPTNPMAEAVLQKYTENLTSMSPMEAFTVAVADWGHDQLELATKRLDQTGEEIPQQEIISRILEESPESMGAILYGNAAFSLIKYMKNENMSIIEFNNRMVDSLHSKYLYWNSDATSDPDIALSADDTIKMLQVASQDPSFTLFFEGEMENIPANLKNALSRFKENVQLFLPKAKELYSKLVPSPQETESTRLKAGTLGR